MQKLGRKAGMAAIAVGLSMPGGGNPSEPQQSKQDSVIVVQAGYYCNTKALTQAERTRHKQLTEKLLTKRRETIETEKGYEFQYAPEDVSVTEAAEWVVAEGKCCPFFDFHIDLEKQGRLICLRLTGGEGIKAFIRSEFGLK